MSVAAGTMLAFMKISVLAFAIMGVIWMVIRAVEKNPDEQPGSESKDDK